MSENIRLSMEGSNEYERLTEQGSFDRESRFN